MSNLLLTATFEESQIASVSREDVPAEVTPAVSIHSSSPKLRLRDSAATDREYDLASVLSDGARYLFFSLRVGPTFAVEGDCLLSQSPELPLQAFQKGEALGIRLQPFYLPECEGDAAELIGRGLFFRGFHFSGVVTPGNVSHVAICDQCRRSFRFQSFHAGFSNLVYFYCESGTHTLVASSYAEGAPQLLAENSPDLVERFEAKLPPCDRCGKRFRYYNSFRCPHCAAAYIDFQRHPLERAGEYYGNHMYRQDPQELSLPLAAG